MVFCSFQVHQAGSNHVLNFNGAKCATSSELLKTFDQVAIAPDGAEVRLRAEGLASVIADITAQSTDRSAA